MKFNDNQIQFIKTNAISKYVYNYNYYVKVKNSFVFVNNKRRKFYNRRNKFKVKKFNNNRKFKRNNTNKDINLIDQINNGDLKNEILFRYEEIIEKFSDFLIIEQEFIFSQIELNKGVDKNTLLKENIFSIFISIITNIPLIIIGKPGSGKSLSAELISKSMKGKYSSNKFFIEFKK